MALRLTIEDRIQRVHKCCKVQGHQFYHLAIISQFKYIISYGWTNYDVKTFIGLNFTARYTRYLLLKQDH